MLVLGEKRSPPDDDDNDDAWAMVHPRETQQSVFTSIVGAHPDVLYRRLREGGARADTFALGAAFLQPSNTVRIISD